MKPGTFWALVPVMLLGSSVLLYMVIVPFMTSDPSHAVVPDYEGRAANWDAVTAQRRANAQLGWNLRVRAPHGTRTDAPLKLLIEVTDREGREIDGAAVSGVALHVARAATRFDFAAVSREGGHYEAEIDSARPGIWEIDVTVRRGDEIFVERRRVTALEPAS